MAGGHVRTYDAKGRVFHWMGFTPGTLQPPRRRNGAQLVHRCAGTATDRIP
jgi:hypothetical protein